MQALCFNKRDSEENIRENFFKIIFFDRKIFVPNSVSLIFSFSSTVAFSSVD